MLELAGHAVQEAHELTSAWRLVETARPDLILLPWTSSKPVRDSLARLREDSATRQARVIVWAAQSDIHEAVNALEFGADDCLAVPFDRAELVARVNACLRRPGCRDDAAGPSYCGSGGSRQGRALLDGQRAARSTLRQPSSA